MTTTTTTTRRLAARRSVAVSATVLIALAACSSNAKINSPATTSSVGSTTTTAAATTTIAPTTTSAAPTSTATPATPVPTIAPPVPTGYSPLGAAKLQMLPEDNVTIPASGFDCATIFAAEADTFTVLDFAWVDQCVQQGDLAGLVYRIPEGRTGVMLLELVGSTWVESYNVQEEFDFEWTSVGMYIGDYAAVGAPAVFVGYRLDGSGSYLDVDIAQRNGTGLDVRGVQGLSHGNVGLPAGGPGVLISAVYADGEPNCCPGNLLYQDLDYVSGAWGVNAGIAYPTASASPVAAAF